MVNLDLSASLEIGGSSTKKMSALELVKSLASKLIDGTSLSLITNEAIVNNVFYFIKLSDVRFLTNDTSLSSIEVFETKFGITPVKLKCDKYKLISGQSSSSRYALISFGKQVASNLSYACFWE